MSLSIIPLVILGQITEASINDDASLYQMTFKDTNGVPLYGVTAVWTDEQAEIEALAAQKSYGVWINPISGTFTVKFAGYTYTGTADLDDPNVLAGITPIEFNNEAAGGGGSEDLKLFNITITNHSVERIGIIVPFVVDDEQDGSFSIGQVVLNAAGSPRSSTEAHVIAYKRMARMIFADPEIASALTVDITGDIKYNDTLYYFDITGDGTVTVSSK